MSSDLRTAIVCAHVAAGKPILRAIRDEAALEADSGWQFLCDTGLIETEADAQVWAIDEVIALDPSVSQFVALAPRAEWARESPGAAWRDVRASET